MLRLVAIGAAKLAAQRKIDCRDLLLKPPIRAHFCSKSRQNTRLGQGFGFGLFVIKRARSAP